MFIEVSSKLEEQEIKMPSIKVKKYNNFQISLQEKIKPINLLKNKM